MISPPRLYAIADSGFGDPVEIAQKLFDAGVRLIQLRNKTASSRVLLEQTSQIVSIAPEGCQVIVNDRADVAVLGGAHGVHLGQDDLPPDAARMVVPDSTLIGVSTHSLEQALIASKERVDYIAVGPIFETSTKENTSPVVGLKGLSEICKMVDCRVVAIGGIEFSNAAAVLGAGATSVAVISDLIGQGDIGARTSEFLKKLDEFGNV